MENLNIYLKIFFIISCYFLGGYISLILIKKFPEEFKSIVIESLAHLKETSIRVKYSKEWDDELEQLCQEEKNNYIESLKSREWIKIDSQKKLNNLFMLYFFGWGILIVIVILSQIFKTLNIYQKQDK